MSHIDLRLVSRRWLLAGLALLSALAVTTARAEAADGLLVGVHDDAQVIGNPTEAFPTLQTLRAQVVRVNLLWHEVARMKPTRARDPADPAYSWGQ